MLHYTSAQNWSTLLARILFSEIYLLSAVGKILDFQGTMAYMVSAGVTSYTKELLMIAIVLELAGSLSILLGLYTRFGAFLLFVFTIGVTIGIHHFWTYPDAEVMNQMINFQKNIAMLGGTLYIMCFGAGQISLDYVRLHYFKSR